MPGRGFCLSGVRLLWQPHGIKSRAVGGSLNAYADLSVEAARCSQPWIARAAWTASGSRNRDRGWRNVPCLISVTTRLLVVLFKTRVHMRDVLVWCSARTSIGPSTTSALAACSAECRGCMHVPMHCTHAAHDARGAKCASMAIDGEGIT